LISLRVPSVSANVRPKKAHAARKADMAYRWLQKDSVPPD